MGEKTNSIGEKALKAGIWYVISNIMVKAISVLTMPIFTRLLNTEQYGTVQTFIAWQSLLIPIFTLNLPYSIGRAKLDFPNKLDDYKGAMQLLSALVSAFIISILIVFLAPVSVLLDLTQVEALLLMAYLFFTPTISLYQTSYKYTYRYKQNIAIAWYTTVVTTLLSLLLVYTYQPENKALMRIIGIVIPNVLLSSIFWFNSIKNKLISIRWEYWKYALKISLPLVLHTISLHILSQSDRIFITKICGKTDTAFYSLAYTYGVALHVITTAVSEGWLPWFHDTMFAGKKDEVREKVKPLVILGCYVGLACIAFAPEAVYLLGGEKYFSSINCIPPVVLGIVCQYVYTHYVNIELHLKKTVYVSSGTIFASLLNIGLNAIFIPKFGFVAAAYTTLASCFALMVVHFLITKKVLHMAVYNDIFMFGSLFVTTIVTTIVAMTYDHQAIRYAITAIGFCSFLYYFRNYIKNLIERFKKKKQSA